MRIQGEYWIIEGKAEYADGDSGDKNHEVYALEHVCSDHLDSLYVYAEKIGIKNLQSFYNMEEDPIGSVKKLFNLILLEPNQTYLLIEKACGFDRDTTLLMLENKKSLDPRIYVMKRKDWIAVRNNNIESFGLNYNKIEQLYNGLNDIIEQEIDFTEEINEENVEFNLFDYKTNKSIDLNLKEIKEKNFFKPNTIPQTTYNKPLPTIKGKKYGREIWRGTSENIKINFKDYMNEVDLYHGTRSNFKELEPRRARMGRGISYTTSPEIAKNYALGKYKGGRDFGEPRVLRTKYDGQSFDFEKPVDDNVANFVINELIEYMNEFTPNKKKLFFGKIKNWKTSGRIFYKEIQKAFAKKGTDEECKLSKSRNEKLEACEKCSAFKLMPDLLNKILLSAGFDSICYNDVNDNISHRCYFIFS
jgi:hypothetical protein